MTHQFLMFISKFIFRDRNAIMEYLHELKADDSIDNPSDIVGK